MLQLFKSKSSYQFEVRLLKHTIENFENKLKLCSIRNIKKGKALLPEHSCEFEFLVYSL